MKTLSFGWEIDQINGTTATMQVPVTQDIVIRGYEVDVAYMPLGLPWSVPIIKPQPGFAEVLANCSFSLPEPAPFGPVKITDSTGKTHGGAAPGGLFALILKGFVPVEGSGSGFGRNSTLSGLSLSVAAGSILTFFMGHAGVPGDCEMQGVIYYD